MENTKTHMLTLYNDHMNSYQEIMAYLIKYCNHELIQAEQCAVIAHNTGKCVIKTGDFMDMFELQTIFNDGNIKTELEVYESTMY
jgi:ATP-dependent Clp protease adaptor protein ClpS